MMKNVLIFYCTLINNNKGQYETTIYRKEAITNIQIKSTSCHDENIKYGIFKGFLHRAKTICTQEYIDEEIKFLVNVFVENGYNRQILEKIINFSNTRRISQNKDHIKFVSLPYVPGISGKLKKVFSDAGFKLVFKSGRNLESILSNRNKPKLPPNSCPGCYRIPCNCGGHYLGQTKKRAVTRFVEHKKAIFHGYTDDSALSEHAIDRCSEDIDWSNAKMISTEPQYFKRCVRESLKIQKEKLSVRKEKIINREDGLYVTTNTWLTLLQDVSKQENMQ